jgi:hypothetical protein
VETLNRIAAEVVKETKIRDAPVKVGGGQPTAAEMSQLTFAKLCDLRTHAQELRNRFARLLNRGSSLE